MKIAILILAFCTFSASIAAEVRLLDSSIEAEVSIEVTLLPTQPLKSLFLSQACLSIVTDAISELSCLNTTESCRDEAVQVSVDVNMCICNFVNIAHITNGEDTVDCYPNYYLGEVS